MDIDTTPWQTEKVRSRGRRDNYERNKTAAGQAMKGNEEGSLGVEEGR
jgi:hypothetical protein